MHELYGAISSLASARWGHTVIVESYSLVSSREDNKHKA